MDFMKILKSFEDLLYEVIVMLVFFPRTLWLTFRFPQRMMDYADTESGDVQSGQYSDTLSPPLFLMMCVGLGHLVERVTPGINAPSLFPSFLKSTENLLAARVLIFSLFPLMMSLRLIHGLNLPLDRETLRAPFHAQCFVAAPVAMSVGFSQAIRHVSLPHSSYLADGLILGAICWYLRQQAHWFNAELDCGLLHGWWSAILASLITCVVFAVSIVSLLVTIG